MRKISKTLTILTVLLVVFAVFSIQAFAEFSTTRLVQNTDMRIEQRIATSVAIADRFAACQATDKVDRTIENLITQTDRMAAQSVNLAARNGCTIINEYIPVNIGGRTVMVDPIRMY